MKKRFNPWPVAITLWFVFLIGVCIWFVKKSMGMNHDLVSSSYYADGLNHDAHQAALARTKALEQPPRITLDAENHRLIVYLPREARGAVLKLYRPSDARLDLKYALQEDGVPSVLSTLSLHPGKWLAKISWEYENRPYYFQEDLFIP
ncbi:MAG: FixH family protein [Kiritimatiellia bacterium]